MFAAAGAARSGHAATMPPYYSRRVPRDRLPPETFDLPVEKIRSGYYTDAYFNFARDALLTDRQHPRVLMQVFQKNRAVLGGIDEAIGILNLCSPDWAPPEGPRAP